MTMYIGLDVHSKLTVFCAQNEQGVQIGRGKAPTSEPGLAKMLSELRAPQATAVALESGTQATWVSRLLAKAGMVPIVVDAREVRAKARNKRQKSDARDAFEICDGLRRGLWVSQVWVPSPEVERVRLLVSRRRHFVSMAVREINAVRFLLRSRGLRGLARSLSTEVGWSHLLGQAPVEPWRNYIELHHDLWRNARQAVHTLEAELLEAARPLREGMGLLESMPGVGPIVSATFVAVIGSPGRFPDSASIVSYAGLAVSTYDSGEKERHGGITRTGSKELRAMLCEAAHHASQVTHPLYPYFARVAARKGVKAAVVVIAQRMARILWRMWRDQRKFDPAMLNVQLVNKVKTKQIHWQIKESSHAVV